MRASLFIRDIFRRYPKLLLSNIGFVSLASIVEASTLLTVGPLIDFLIYTDFEKVSPLTKKVVGLMGSAGLPVTLKSYLLVFVVFVIVL